MNKIFILILILAGSVYAADLVRVAATGKAGADLPNAREAAIEAALRQAVEVGGGVSISGITEVRDYQLVEDVIYAKTAGLVEKYEVVQENPNQDGLYTVRVEAVVSRADINARLEAWKSLAKRKGRPRVMVVGSVDKQPFQRRLTAHVQDILEQKSFTVIDLDMVEENKRLDAERAAKGDLDPIKAALITRQAGADYFIVVQVEGTRFAAQSYHGVMLYPVDATAIIKVIAADTSRVIASKVVSDSRNGETTERAMEEVTTLVTTLAMNESLKRIAVNWLEDLDQRGSTQIKVVANAFSFERLEALTKGLRALGDVKDIIIDNTDYQGQSSFRVVSNNLTINIASVLKTIDSAIIITSSSKYQIEISPAKTPASNVGLPDKTIFAYAVGVLAVILVIVAAVKLFN